MQRHQNCSGVVLGGKWGNCQSPLPLPREFRAVGKLSKNFFMSSKNAKFGAKIPIYRGNLEAKLNYERT